MLQIVQTDADQPWITRQVADNGEEVWRSSENYTHLVSARRAVELLLEEFGHTPEQWGRIDPKGPTWWLTALGPDGESTRVEVDVLDERGCGEPT